MNVGRFLLTIKELVSLLEMGPVIGRGIGRIRPVSSIVLLLVYVECPPVQNRLCMLSDRNMKNLFLCGKLFFKCGYYQV